MTKKVAIAIVGATGVVGKTVLEILASRKFPLAELYPLASSRSHGHRVLGMGQLLTVTDVAQFDFSQAQIAIFSAGASVSAEHAPRAAAAGCVVIDNTSHFRYDADIPLVISEVNPEALGQYRQRNIIANPNCSTMQLLVALKPIYDAVGITRINVATYQAVSGAGTRGMQELHEQSVRILSDRDIAMEVFAKPIGFNVLPQIDVFLDNGYTKEEMKMVWETRKILNDDTIQINPTAVRVPVFHGHAEAVHIETHDKISAENARILLSKAPGVIVVDEQVPGGYPTPATEAAGQDAVYVGRIREDISHPQGLNLWVVADNTRKGAALNAVQLAEILVQDYL